MRDFGKVYGTFWTSDTTSHMSDTAKLLALYLMTTTHATIAGVFRMPDGYVSEDLHWPIERVAEGFGELFDTGFATRCNDTKWVWIKKHLEWNAPENPNQIKSAKKIAVSVPENCTWRAEFYRCAAPILGLEAPNPLATLPKPSLNQKQEQKQKQKKEPSSAGADQMGFDAFWKAWPANSRKVGKRQCLAKWVGRKCAEHADAIVAHVEAMKKTEKWREDGGRFIPLPMTYLNQDRWEAPTESEPLGNTGTDAVDATGAYLAEQAAHAAAANSPEAQAAREAALAALGMRRKTQPEQETS